MTVLLAALTAVLARPACARPVAHVNVGVLAIVSALPLDIAQEKGFFREEGLEVRLIDLQGQGRSGAVFNALLNGSVDVGRMGYRPVWNDAFRRSGIRIVADATRTLAGKQVNLYFLVRKGLAGVRAWADLRGRRVASTSPGDRYHLDLLKNLRGAGLTEKDLTILYPTPAVSAAMLMNREVDVGIYNEPQAGQLVRTGVAEVFAGTDIARETFQSAVLLYSGAFMARSDGAPLRFMTAYLRGLREFYRMPKEELLALAKKRWGFPISAEELSAVYVSTDGAVLAGSLMETQDLAIRFGLTDARLKEEELVDTRFIRRANAVLKDRERARKP